MPRARLPFKRHVVTQEEAILGRLERGRIGDVEFLPGVAA